MQRTEPSDTKSVREKSLEDRILRVLPQEDDLHLSPFRPVSSGSSNETVAFDMIYKKDGEISKETLILRYLSNGPRLFPDYDLAFQLQLLIALADTAIPVPRLIAYECEKNAIDTDFILMEYVEGVVPSDRPPGLHGQGLFYEASIPKRRELWWAALQQIVNIHTLDWRRLALPDMIGMQGDVMAAHIARIEHWLSWSGQGPLPVIDRALRWLRDNSIAPRASSLLWGDARPGNIIYRDDKVAAVVDWELATIGPPELDLAYFIAVSDVVAEQHSVPRLEGLPSREETIAKYEEMRGVKVRDFRYAEIYVLTELAVIISLAVKSSPSHSKYPDDFLTNNSPTHKLETLLSQ